MTSANISRPNRQKFGCTRVIFSAAAPFLHSQPHARSPPDALPASALMSILSPSRSSCSMSTSQDQKAGSVTAAAIATATAALKKLSISASAVDEQVPASKLRPLITVRVYTLCSSCDIQIDPLASVADLLAAFEAKTGVITADTNTRLILKGQHLQPDQLLACVGVLNGSAVHWPRNYGFLPKASVYSSKQPQLAT